MTEFPSTRLAEVLAEQERSQAWLARQLGVSRQRIGKWTSGRFTPQASNQQKIAAALGRTVSDVFPHAHVVNHTANDERTAA